MQTNNAGDLLLLLARIVGVLFALLVATIVAYGWIRGDCIALLTAFSLIVGLIVGTVVFRVL